jgi:hypothetical protein
MLTRAELRVVVVMTLGALVYWSVGGGATDALARKQPKAADKATAAPTATGPAQPTSGAAGLPGGVVEMRDAILAAVQSGNIDDMKTALQWNELPPVVAAAKVDDPIAYWKSISGDGRGLEILAILDAVFAAGHIVLPLGRDVENNQLYVWPRFAEMDLSKLKPEDEVQLYRLATPAAVKEMIAKKRWLGYRLAIGADGTWHAFQKAE